MLAFLGRVVIRSDDTCVTHERGLGQVRQEHPVAHMRHRLTVAGEGNLKAPLYWERVQRGPGRGVDAVDIEAQAFAVRLLGLPVAKRDIVHSDEGVRGELLQRALALDPLRHSEQGVVAQRGLRCFVRRVDLHKGDGLLLGLAGSLALHGLHLEHDRIAVGRGAPIQRHFIIVARGDLHRGDLCQRFHVQRDKVARARGIRRHERDVTNVERDNGDGV